MPAYIIFTDRTLIEMAERRPQTLDAMMGITGIGAKKLDTYGAAFLEILTGAPVQPLHPARMKLAGRQAAELFDLLAEAQLALSRGKDGTGKFLSCTHSTLAQLADRKPRSLGEMEHIQGMGPLKVERFGAAFLQILSGEA